MDVKMYVRYIGNQVCFTLEDGRFYMLFKSDCTPEEIAMCDNGGRISSG